MTTVENISKAVIKCAPEYGVERVWLFGSYAKGDADEKSDVNLRIDKGECKGLRVAAFACALESELQVQVDLLSSVVLQDETPEKVQSIKNGEMLLYEKKNR